MMMWMMMILLGLEQGLIESSPRESSVVNGGAAYPDNKRNELLPIYIFLAFSWLIVWLGGGLYAIH